MIMSQELRIQNVQKQGTVKFCSTDLDMIDGFLSSKEEAGFRSVVC